MHFGWDILPHPPYSPDLAPTDYHLFRTLSNDLREKKFDDESELKVYLTNFFNSQSLKFYREGIESLPMRWRQVVDNDGQYIID